MTEKRLNWKQNISQQARKRHNQKLELLTNLDEIREKLKTVDVKSPDYDRLMQQRRNLSAQIATL